MYGAIDLFLLLTNANKLLTIDLLFHFLPFIYPSFAQSD